MPDFFAFINEILWGSVMIYLLLGAGFWFTYRTGFVQFRYVRQFGKSLKNSINPQPGGLTSFQALCTSLAARIGSGNLAGVALAIAAGGAGAVFWMWVSAVIGMATHLPNAHSPNCIKNATVKASFAADPRGIWRAGWHALDGRSVRHLFTHCLWLSF